ncbi:hypothetical protein ID866_6538 [Astraeus odoratus]|nr:hypothetical protein ID866_6538 [Astraeus odoratus]
MASARSLPTLQRLGSTVDPTIDARSAAKNWFTSFVDAMSAKDVVGILDLLLDDVFWRDMLALTWDFHTYEGKDAVKRFLGTQLPKFDPTSFKLHEDLIGLQKPFEDVAWIQAFFTFDTTVGHASGIFRLVPCPDESWKAHVVYTNLDDLRGFPEQIGILRNHKPYHGNWGETREIERAFLEVEPSVVIVGGGQTGLEIAARLKMLGVSALVVEQTKRIGDIWRERYAVLCLQDPIWRNHMPYLPFPPSWPVYIPGWKLGDWLESYANALDLNVWTSTRVVSIEPGAMRKKWSVKVVREDGTERIFSVNHVVLAMGYGNNVPKIPDIPDRGQILHSSEYKVATDHLGKSVIVVGACTSAHEICSDYESNGIDVTMVQRSSTHVVSIQACTRRLFGIFGRLYCEGGPPIDIADRISASFPIHLLRLLFQRHTKHLAEADRDLLDGLRNVGFRLTSGEDGSGLFVPLFKKIGGHYLDRGPSQKIIDGKIKLKADGRIAKFTRTGLQFEDGSTLDADVVLFATGFAETRGAYLKLLPSYLHDFVQPILDLDDEGEVNSVAREIGGRGPKGEKLAGIWTLLGNLAGCRFHSKHMALQIKAYEEGILKFNDRY